MDQQGFSINQLNELTEVLFMADHKDGESHVRASRLKGTPRVKTFGVAKSTIHTIAATLKAA